MSRRKLRKSYKNRFKQYQQVINISRLHVDMLCKQTGEKPLPMISETFVDIKAIQGNQFYQNCNDFQLIENVWWKTKKKNIYLTKGDLRRTTINALPL